LKRELSTAEPANPFQIKVSPRLFGLTLFNKGKLKMKMNLMTVAILVGVVLVALKFRTQLVAAVSKVPVLGPLVA